MELSVIFTTLLNIFVTSPNLCEDVYLDSTGSPYTDSTGQTLPRYCEWTGPDAPVWDADVCCSIDRSGAHCSQPDGMGRCPVGLKMYCEHGALMPGGDVACYQPFPSMCDVGSCIQPPDVPPPGTAVWGACCSEGGACQHVSADDTFECPDGQYVVCEDGYLHDDGTVECYS